MFDAMDADGSSTNPRSTTRLGSEVSRRYREQELRADRDALQSRLHAAEAEGETRARQSAMQKPWQRALEEENQILVEDRDAALSLARRAQGKLTRGGDAIHGREEAEQRSRTSRLAAHALEMDKTQLEVELARLHETHASTCRDLQEAISRGDEAEVTLETAMAKMASLRHFKEEAQGEFTRLHQQVEEVGQLRLAKDRLEREVSNQGILWNELEKVRKMKNELERQNTDLACTGGERDILKHRVAELQGETKRLYAQLDVSQRDVDEYKRDNLRLKIIEAEISSPRGMQSDYEVVSRERDAASYKAEKKESELLSVHEKLERALEWEREATALRHDLMEYRTLLEARQGEITNLKEAREDLLQRLSHFHGVDIENDRLRAEVESLEAAGRARDEGVARQVTEAQAGKQATAKLEKMENALAQLSSMEAPVGMGNEAMLLYINDAKRTVQFIVNNSPERFRPEANLADKFAPGKLKAYQDAKHKKRPKRAGY